MVHPLSLPPLGPVLPWLDMAGLAVFAASGALAAARARQTFVTFCFFACVTGTGGGTTRDLLIGAPVFWLRDPASLGICLAMAALVWLVPRRWWPEAALDWCDAAGLAAYAVYGAGKALSYDVPPLPAAMMGVVSACLGGIIRDVVAGVPSIILRPELYVTAAALAAGLFVGLTRAGLAAPWPAAVAVLAGFALRAAAIARGLALPAYRG
ncbi:trimeric intracellular cation channel family protein [Sphingomonas morindae]|uniref:TRIC cation channel family protein n=1 Tax=Sphingomonas morindae TaxID=1541170 RepID=A0ABY4X8M6_9SPHN|nr:TRIC cation channel family protein [Sphingomonas morindae]USI73277.1 TRIC cation channel family protein [Sphingomonas morindae]